MWIIDAGENSFPIQLWKTGTPMDASEREEKQRIFCVASARAGDRLT